jgi:geranylgeranyl pyrophosphate synthase
MNKPFPYSDELLDMVQAEVESYLTEFELHDLKSRYSQYQRKIGISKYRKLLPASAYLAAGGKELEETTLICGAFELLIYSLKMFDDLQDRDNDDGIWNHGLSDAQRMNNAFVFLNLAYFLLSNMDVQGQMFQDMSAMITSSLVLAGIAQIDETQQERKLSYAENVYSKSSLFYGFIVACGAMLADTDESVVFALKRVGEKLGTIYQLADDYVDELGVSDYVTQSSQELPPLSAGWKEKIPNTIFTLKQEIEEILQQMFPSNQDLITFYFR